MAARTKAAPASPWLKLYEQLLQDGYSDEEARKFVEEVLGPPPLGALPPPGTPLPSPGKSQGEKKTMPSTSSIFDRARRNLGGPRRPVRVNAKKAITTASAPTIIEPEVADRLIDYVIDESVLLSMIRTERMDTNVKHLRFVDVGTGLLHPGGCASNDNNCDQGTVTGTAKQLSTKPLQFVVPICDDVLEDNLEGAAFEDHVLRMVASQISNELEIWMMMADQGGTYQSPQVRADVLILMDGLYQQLQTGHVLNGITDPNGRFIESCKLVKMIQALPTKYRKNRNNQIFIPDDMKWDYVGHLKNRGTPLGDDAITGKIPLSFGDMPINPVPLLPTDIHFCSTGSVAANGTFMFLSDPDNLVWGVERNITFERERKGCQGRTYLIWTLRVDFLIENVDETVLFDCMDVGNCDLCECV